MVVAVMQVRIMPVAVAQAAMLMRVAVRLAPVPGKGMLVAMVLVMHMRMAVLELFVYMLVFVPLRKMQPDACGHQRGRAPEREGRRFRQDGQRDGCAEERRDREIGTGARGAEVWRQPPLPAEARRLARRRG